MIENKDNGKTNAWDEAEKVKQRFPFFTSIRPSLTSKQICGATLVAPDLALTAAHCDINLDDHVLVGISKTEPDSYEKHCRVTEVTDHTNYTQIKGSNGLSVKKLDHDFKMIKFKPPVYDVTPIKLINYRLNFPSMDNYGVTSIGLGTKKEVQKFSLTTADKCHSLIANNTKSQFCAKAASDNSDICRDDSGSPLLGDDDVLIGILSYAPPCNNDLTNFEMIFGEVSKVAEWIQNTICDMSSHVPFDCDKTALFIEEYNIKKKEQQDTIPVIHDDVKQKSVSPAKIDAKKEHWTTISSVVDPMNVHIALPPKKNKKVEDASDQSAPCSICGEGREATNLISKIDLGDGITSTCSSTQEDGESGVFSIDECKTLLSFAEETCGCKPTDHSFPSQSGDYFGLNMILSTEEEEEGTKAEEHEQFRIGPKDGRLRNKSSIGCLDPKNHNFKNGTPVEFFSCKYAKEWDYDKETKQIKLKDDKHMCLDIAETKCGFSISKLILNDVFDAPKENPIKIKVFSPAALGAWNDEYGEFKPINMVDGSIKMDIFLDTAVKGSSGNDTEAVHLKIQTEDPTTSDSTNHYTITFPDACEMPLSTELSFMTSNNGEITMVVKRGTVMKGSYVVINECHEAKQSQKWV